MSAEFTKLCRQAKLDLESARNRLAWAEKKRAEADARIAQFTKEVDSAFEAYSSLLKRNPGVGPKLV